LKKSILNKHKLPKGDFIQRWNDRIFILRAKRGLSPTILGGPKINLGDQK
jgi:hypothetical protein